MARQPATRLQISGHRFLLRRMAHALVRGDVGMLDDPPRAQSLSLLAGAILAVIAIAACALLAVVKPKGALGDAPIVMVRESGEVYVRIGDVMHPVLNTASAKLVAGAAEPQLVSASAIESARRGPSVGIPGAPNTIGRPLESGESGWSVCEDASGTTTVIVGAVPDRRDSDPNVLVVARQESAAATFLLYDGRRARVDLRDHAVIRALGLENAAPRHVSRALLDALPEAPPITTPRITGAGSESMLPGLPVGSVVRVTSVGSPEHYVVLENGVQRIGEVAADLIRFTQPQGQRDIVTVAPATIGTLPVVDDVPVGTFPERGGVAEAPVLCVHWAWSAGSDAVNNDVSMSDSLPASAGEQPLGLAQTDHAGPAVDNVLLPRGRSVYVRAAGITGEGAQNGALQVVSGAGVVFGIRNPEAAKRLGLTTPPVPGPWPVLARLPRGPELSVDGASIMRDTIGPPA